MPTSRPDAELRPRRILVIDDYQDGADALADLLRTDGAVVEVAYDAETALARASTGHPSIAFLDLSLGPTDGCELIGALRAAAGAPIRVVAFSGWNDPRDRARAQQAGFDHFLVKGAAIDLVLEQSRILPPSQP